MNPDAMIGVTLGNYRIASKLGQGGMGAVYLAEHDVLGRKAAIKILLPQLSHQRESLQRFFHEARTTAQLRHPAMVDVFDYGTLPDGRAFLIMDYLEGECLEARIDRLGPLPVRDALHIARQIAVGVNVAHAEQIVHRDLKPDNIFLIPAPAGSVEERVKILDFGIAKLGSIADDQRITRAGTLVGTPLYMAPEQCRGDHDIDGRADIYALGCILFTMLAGRPPFLSNSFVELVTLHQLAPAPRLHALGVQVPASVEDLLADMLEKDRDQRLPTMTAVASRMTVLLQDETVTAGSLPVAVAAASGREAETLRDASGSIRVLRKRLTGAHSVPAITIDTVSRSQFDRGGASDTGKRTTPAGGKRAAGSSLGRRMALAGGGVVLAGALGLALLRRSTRQEAARGAGPGRPVAETPAAPPVAPEAPPPPVAEGPDAGSAPGITTAPAAGPSPAAAKPAGRAARAARDPGDKAPGKVSDKDSKEDPAVYRGTRLEIEKRLPY